MDTLDLVVIGGYLGTGDHVGHYTAFLMACYDEKTKNSNQCVSKNEPDHWFDAVQVKGADYSISPTQYAAVDPVKGSSLRFLHFCKILRDRLPCEATKSSQVAEKYHENEERDRQEIDQDLY